MNQPVHLAVDIQGGDFGTEVTLPAVVEALSADSGLSITAVGLPEIEQQIQNLDCEPQRLKFQPCESAIGMEEKVVNALRKARGSSIGEVLSLVGRGCDGAVSAGNTAALVACGTQILGCFDHMQRPVLGTAIPSSDGHTWLLDIGANLEVSIDQLHQFALLGSALCASSDGVEQPRIGLLNVGMEQSKGTVGLQDAAKSLQQDARLNYVGFAEGNDIFGDRFDVVVTDGMNGNVALKSTEGAARFILNSVRGSLLEGLRSRIGVWMLKPSLNRFRQKMDPSRYNGAPLLGLQGLVVKSHGSANQSAFLNSIQLAASLARSGVVNKIGDSLANL